MARVLRKRTRVCYYEPEEPSFDEYTYCTSCRDYVYEYCSIHGPLLVVPDDKVSSPTGYPPIVPRAALTIPKVFLHLAESDIPGAGIGVFSTLTLPAGVRFGPYRGARAHDATGSRYCWQIFNREHKPSWLVDARDAATSNWMRYVNCSRHYSEQNLVAYQYQGQIYYRTIRIVPRMTELLVFYGSEFALELGVDLRRYRKSLPIIDLQRNIQVHELEENANIPTSPDEEEGSNNFTSMLVGNTSGHTAVIGNDKEEEDFVCENKIQDTEQSNNNETTNVVDQNIFIFDERGRSCNEKASLIYDTSVHKMNEITKPPTTSNVIMNYLCEICNSKFISKSELINHHIEEHDSKIKYKACDQCNYKTSSTYNLNRHMIIHTSHTSENPHKCTVCNSNLNRIDELKRHLKTHTGIKPHKCTICDSKFHRRDQLKNHLRTHTVEKPYQCTICNSKFSHYYSLKSHLRIHTAEKPYNCTVCNSKFTARHSLKTHTRTHNGESYQLTRLLKSHTGEKPYQCTVCDSKFSVRSRLKIHLRIHTGEKPYQCTVCDSKFAARGYLKRHLRTHTDEKPYQCTVCDSKFRDGYKLKIHFRTHTGEKPYQCTVCDSKFRDGSKLKIHLRTHTTGDKPY